MQYKFKDGDVVTIATDLGEDFEKGVTVKIRQDDRSTLCSLLYNRPAYTVIPTKFLGSDLENKNNFGIVFEYELENEVVKDA